MHNDEEKKVEEDEYENWRFCYACLLSNCLPIDFGGITIANVLERMFLKFIWTEMTYTRIFVILWCILQVKYK